jgi:hypothetical protein
MVEARDEAEAIFRASNHFKKLGHYVHNAVIVEQNINEEVQQIDEDALKARQEWMNAKGVSTGDPKADRARRVKRLMKTFPMKKEEVKQIDELSPGTYRAAAEKRRQQSDDIIISNNKFGIDNSSDDHAAVDSLQKKANKLIDTASRRNQDRLFNAAQAQKNAALSAATKRLLKVNTKPRFTKANEEVEQLDELRPATYWNAAKKRNLQADTLPDNSTGSTDSAAQKIYKMANKLHNAGQKRAVDREENAKIDHVAATLSPATRKKLGINTNHQFTKADGTVVRKEEVELDEALDHEVNNYAKHMLNAHSADDLHVGNEHRDMAHQTLQDIKKNYGPVGVRWANARAGEHIENHNKAQRDAQKASTMRNYKPTPPGAKVYQYPKSEVKEEVVNEKAPPGAKYERMVKHIKNQYSKDGTLTPKEKAIAYATAWKAKNSGK